MASTTLLPPGYKIVTSIKKCHRDGKLVRLFKPYLQRRRGATITKLERVSGGKKSSVSASLKTLMKRGLVVRKWKYPGKPRSRTNAHIYHWVTQKTALQNKV